MNSRLHTNIISYFKKVTAKTKISCVYCEGNSSLRHQSAYHRFNIHHGPFDIYECNDCGAAQTYPLPSVESLNKLYQTYVNGLPNLHRMIMEQDPQSAMYEWCVNRIKNSFNYNLNSKFSWIEIGAGGGELSLKMAEAFPESTGIAVDLHPSPIENCSGIIQWKQLNLNTDEISENLPLVDLIVSVGVWEHVLNPGFFINNLLKLLKTDGALYLLCPNNSSLASLTLKSHWPLFIPGEHITIPTKIGAKKIIYREWEKLHLNARKIEVTSKSVMFPYTIGYFLKRLGLNTLSRLVPKGLSLPMPVGGLETIAKRK